MKLLRRRIWVGMVLLAALGLPPTLGNGMEGGLRPVGQVLSGPGAPAASRPRTSGKVRPANLPVKRVSAQGPVADTRTALSEAEVLRRTPGAKATAKPGRRVHKLGLLPAKLKPELYRGLPAPPKVQPQTLPATCDLSADLPPVGDQGAQGSCAAWAVGYYYKTYQEGRDQGWSVNTPDHLCSPAFLYNQVAPFDEGATFDEMMNLLVQGGCGPLTECAYKDSDCTTWPSYKAFLTGLPFRALSYTRLGSGSTDGIVTTMKTQLAGGDLCVIGLPIYRPAVDQPGAFDVLGPTNYSYQMPAVEDVYNAGGHALTVVGYDDSLFNGGGGFKIVNSWGSAWGSHGFAYLSYQFIRALVFDVYTMTDRPHYQPTATARFRLSHSFWGWNYDNVTITLGCGSTATPLWSHVFLTELERDSLEVDMAVDLTDAASYLPPTWSQPCWMKFSDRSIEDSGTLKIFEVTTGGTTYSSAACLPLTTSYWGWTSVYLPLPAGTRAASNYYVNDGGTTGDQYCTAAGSDSADGLSPATPMRTVQAVIDRYLLRGGDTVWIDAGTYDLTANVTISYLDNGSAGTPVRFVGALAPNGEPATVLSRSGSGACFSFNGSQYTRLENMRLQGGATSVSAEDGWADHISLSGMVLAGAANDALRLWETYDVALDRCRAYGTRNVLRVNRSNVRLNQCSLQAGTGQHCLGLYSSESDYASGAYANVVNSILAAPSGVAIYRDDYTHVNLARHNIVFGGSGFPLDNSNLRFDPQFANPSAGDLHLKSAAGRWDPLANGGAGGWVVDTVTSPAIDAGDPATEATSEPAPSGGRLNIGAYGGTPYASKSAPTRTLAVVSPNGGESWSGRQTVTWGTWGSGWSEADTVKLEYYDGTAWHSLGSGADSVPYAAGSFPWNVSGAGITPGSGFRVRVTANADAAATDGSDAVFSVVAPVAVNYYVNDTTTTNDVYCTAVGDDANDGLTPATPRASVQTIIDEYDLGPGDTIYFDTGTYVLTSHIEFGKDDCGDNTGYLRLLGSPRGTILQRSTAVGGSYAIHLNSAYCIWLEGLSVTGASQGIVLASSGGAVVRGNRLYGNTSTALSVDYSSNGAQITNNLFSGNGLGIMVNGSSTQVVNNTVYGAGNGVTCSASAITFRNNLVAVSGTPLNFSGAYREEADYNCYWQNGTAVDLKARQAAGQELHSLSVDPQFSNAAGGDFHLKSAGGRWDPGTASWVSDATTSPCVDAGDPATNPALEPAPSGSRINLGADGGTAEASKSAPGRTLVLQSPLGGESWIGTHSVCWLASGQGWGSSGSVKLQYSTNSGGTWTDIAGATSLPWRGGTYAWNPAGLPTSTHYRVRVVCNQDTALWDACDSDFALRSGVLTFYVNDMVRTNDVYCTAVGSDTNDGLTPATPKATPQAVFEAYNLEPGDTVYVDTGTYMLSRNWEVKAEDAGSAEAYLRIIGSPKGTVINRTNTAAGNYALYLNGAPYVWVEGFSFTGGASGLRVAYSSSYPYTDGCVVVGNRCYGNASSGLYLSGGSSNDRTLTVQRNLIYNNPTGLYAENWTTYRTANALVTGNTLQATSYGAELRYAAGLKLTHNIVVATTKIYQTSDPGAADYNCYWLNGAAVDLRPWQAAGRDVHSLSGDPRFADATSGDFHLKSTGGRWNLASGTWVADGMDSPALDAGDPGADLGAEVAPHGSRRNLGAYGDTTEASKSPRNRFLTLLTPSGGQVWRGTVQIRWLAVGQAWTDDDRITVEYSPTSGSAWQPIDTTGVPYRTGQFNWDSGTVPNGTRYRLRLACQAAPTTYVTTTADASIVNGAVNYYVNDNSTADDIYCNALGSDSYDGLSRSRPKASLASILAAYDLEPGDTVYVDTGQYNLTANTLLDAQDSGSAAAWVTIQGNPHGTVLNRANTTTGNWALELGSADYVRLRGLRLTGGSSGLKVGGALHGVEVAQCAVYGNTGVGLDASSVQTTYTGRVTVTNSRLYNNGGNGATGNYSRRLQVRSCTLYGNGTAALNYADVTGSIVVSTAAGRYCYGSNCTGDYNDLYATGGGAIAQGRATLGDWQRASGQDRHSLSQDPLFADAGAGSFALKSTAGRYSPSTRTWVYDSVDSPGLDAGDPRLSVGSEPTPNAERLNLGFEAGTTEASKTPTAKSLQLVTPNGAETLAGTALVYWIPRGTGWDLTREALKIELSRDSGSTWETLVDTPGVAVAAREWEWDTSSLPNGTRCRLRLTSLNTATATARSNADFALNNAASGGRYYVNDNSRSGDEYCSAVGSDSNDGLSPATPRASVASILTDYTLAPGDTVYIDSGNYTLSEDLGIGGGGSAGLPITFQGVKGKTVFDRNDTAEGVGVNVEGGHDLVLRGLSVRRARVGIYVYGSNAVGVRECAVQDCSGTGVYLNDTINCTLTGSTVVQTGGTALMVLAWDEGWPMSSPGTVVANNTFVVSNATGMGFNCWSGPVVKNNIVHASGSGSCISTATRYVARCMDACDYNCLYATGGAKVSGSGDLADWQGRMGYDLHSFSLDPLFADLSGGDYHLRSAQGRYNPRSGLPPTDAGAWLTDSVTSPCVDAGDPSDSVRLETSPNGGRINLGMEGGTWEASRGIVTPRVVQITAPNGGQILTSTQAVNWRTSGTAWGQRDTVKLEYSADAGATWRAVDGAQSVLASRGAAWFDTSALSNGWGYQVRVTCNQDAAVTDTSDGYIGVANGGQGTWPLYVAPTGVDDTLHGTGARPFRTVTYALQILRGALNTPRLTPGRGPNRLGAKLSATSRAQVRVAAGTYSERVAPPPFVDLLGGYRAADWSRDPQAQVTILDGGAGGSVVVAAADTLIEGFTLTNGRTSNGAGIVCDGVSPTIRGNRLIGNVATGAGGTIYCRNGAPTIVGNVFTGNSGVGGGTAISCDNAPALVTNNVIYANTNTTGSGGISCNGAAPQILSNTLARNTSASSVGMVHCLNNASPTITNCLVVSALAGKGVSAVGATPTVRYCDVYANAGGNYGGLTDQTGLNGNVAVDPLFADALGGDYHLQSQGGRWNGATRTWVVDGAHSPVIDAGDLTSDFSQEPLPSGGRINLGAYGNTVEASKWANLPPSTPSAVVLTPPAPRTAEDLTAAASGSTDGNWQDTVTYEYEWSKSTDGGTTWSAWADPGATLPHALTSRNEKWRARARAYDGASYSATWLISDPLTVRNTAPLAPTSAGIAPAAPLTADTLVATATGATDADSDPLTYEYAWAKSTDDGATWSDWGNAGATLAASLTTRGERWKMTARATDGNLTGPWLESAPVTIGNTAPPAPPAVAIAPAAPRDADNLVATATPAADADGDTLTFRYQWAKSQDGGATWSDWGNPGATLAHTLTASGDTWKARASADDGTADSAWTESAAVTVDGRAPTAPTTVVLGPATPGDGDDLTAVASGSTDPDGDTVTYTYEWAKSTDGGLTWDGWGNAGATLRGTLTRIGERWKARARGSDGVTYGPWTESGPLAVVSMMASRAPRPGHPGCSRRTSILITFRWRVQQASAESHFQCTPTGSATPVAGTFTWPVANSTLRFQPSRPLEAAASYTVKMTSGLIRTGLSPTNWSEAWSFTAGSEPTVVSWSRQGTGAPLTTKITATFDQNMHRVSVQRNFAVKPAVGGTFAWSRRQVIFTPQAPLAPGTKYTVTVGRKARSATGVDLGRPFVWSFTTAPASATAVVAAATETVSGAQVTLNLTSAATVTVEICNLAGRTVARLPARALPAGVSTLLWDKRALTGAAVPGGCYLLRAQARGAGGQSASALTALYLRR